MQDSKALRRARVYMLLNMVSYVEPQVKEADLTKAWAYEQMLRDPRLTSALGDAWAGLRERTSSAAIILTCAAHQTLPMLSSPSPSPSPSPSLGRISRRDKIRLLGLSLSFSRRGGSAGRSHPAAGWLL
jgi:hypothetical protein